MTDHDDIGVLSEVVRSQMAEGIARDLAIKLLARLVSQVVGSSYADIVQGHARAIEEPDPGNDEMNAQIASHFRRLMLEEEDAD